MPKFLNTSATSYHLEELIKSARERLILISPYLKLNQRIKELLSDKDRLKIDVRIVYGKAELAASEADWLASLRFVRTAFCRNLHAKCYLSETACIVTSLNLYEFSQVNNNEMGVLVSRSEDGVLYRDAFEEAQRLLRISDEGGVTTERSEARSDFGLSARSGAETQQYAKLTTGKIAAKLGFSTKAFFEALELAGYVENRAGRHFLTEAGKRMGGEWRPGNGGGYLIWPAEMSAFHFDRRAL